MSGMGISTPSVYQDLLPRHRASFAVLTDTHLVDPTADHAGEFGSRLKQNDRVDTALALVASLGVDTVVHLGDLVQDYPDSDTHRPLLALAVEQVRAVAREVHCASGNTDVGDKTDPSSPAVLAGPATMASYTEIAAPAWSVFEVAGLRGIILSSSLFTSGTDLEAAQWSWLEEVLATDVPTVLFWHHALFLGDRDDPGLGNYDTIAEPARSRLLSLVEDHQVLGVFTGHSHFWFRTVLGPAAQGYGISSTSFTRPGFSELFSSAAPPDRGRDDEDKLGFVVVRVHPDGLRVHQVRSGTTTRLRLVGREVDPVLTGTPRDCPGSSLGLVVRHPIATFAEIPDTFPSVVRQPVRDDHPLLGCLESGAAAVSVGIEDCRDPRLDERLALLRREGVTVTARAIWAVGDPVPVIDPGWSVDRIELVLLARAQLTAEECRAVAGLGIPVTMSTLSRLPRGRAELPRWRYGFASGEAVPVAEGLAAVGVASTVLLADGEVVPAATEEVRVERIHQLRGTGPGELLRLAEAQLGAAADGSRLWVDGLTELDRTLERSPGLLDRMRNPQPPHHLVRILSTLCHAAPSRIRRGEHGRWLIERDDLTAEFRPDPGVPPEGAVVIDLGHGVMDRSGSPPTGPCLVVTPAVGGRR